MTDQPLPPVKIAFVIDGEVVDVLHTDDRLAAIFLSQPTILDVTAWHEQNPHKRLVGGTYDGETFTPAATPSPEELAAAEAAAQA
jgi:hypothetical protein